MASLKAEGIDDGSSTCISTTSTTATPTPAESRDPQRTAAGSDGWLDGTPNITWGRPALPLAAHRHRGQHAAPPLQGARPGPALQRPLRLLAVARRGNQMLLIDGVDTGLAGNVASGVRSARPCLCPERLPGRRAHRREHCAHQCFDRVAGMANLVILEEETLAPLARRAAGQRRTGALPVHGFHRAGPDRDAWTSGCAWCSPARRAGPP